MTDIPKPGDRVRLPKMPEYECVVEAVKDRYPYVMRARLDSGAVFHAYAADVELVPYVPPPVAWPLKPGARIRHNGTGTEYTLVRREDELDGWWITDAAGREYFLGEVCIEEFYKVVSTFTVPTFASTEEAERWMESLNAGAD